MGSSSRTTPVLSWSPGATPRLGEFEEAFTILDEVVAGHGARVHQVIQDPVFDPLRSDPRFDDLLRRIGVD